MKALTVRGPVPADQLGLTLIHEHLLFDFGACLAAPRSDAERRLAEQPLHLATRGDLRFNPCLVPDNLIQTDIALAIEELADFAALGGTTILDPTNRSIGRDPKGLLAISEATGLHIVMGCGYYYQIALDRRFTALSLVEVEAEIVSDITAGVDGTGIRAGVIGEVGTSSPLTPDEVKSLRASARAQARTGAPLMIHLDGWSRAGHTVVDTIIEEGGRMDRIILCHMNPSWNDPDYQISLLDRGVYLEYDMFGNDHYYPGNEFIPINRAAPDEISALNGLAGLIGKGYLNQLLISQDVYLKMMLRKYGGYGYVHILKNLRPYLAAAGITDADQGVLLRSNPQRVLGFIA